MTTASCVFPEENRHGSVLRRMFNACLLDEEEPSRQLNNEHLKATSCRMTQPCFLRTAKPSQQVLELGELFSFFGDKFDDQYNKNC